MENKTIEKIKAAKNRFEQEVENAVRGEVAKIFRRHKNLVSYDDSMGLCSFTDNKGNPVFLTTEYMTANWEYRYRPTYKTFKTLLDIYSEADSTGCGISLNR